AVSSGVRPMPALRLPVRLERLRPYAPWGAMAALCALFELPTMMRPDRLDPTAIRPTGEIIVVLTVYAACCVWRAPRIAYVGLLVFTVALVLVRLDWAVYFLITRSEPLLYDQLFMLRHLVVLISDLWSLGTAAVVVGFVAACSFLVWVARFLLAAMEPVFLPRQRRKLAGALAGAWLVVLAG